VQTFQPPRGGYHYHLLPETPMGNLVDAMKWFQGTFTQRYNVRHKLRGHLFQGRYKAKVSRAMRFYDQAEGNG